MLYSSEQLQIIAKQLLDSYKQLRKKLNHNTNKNSDYRLRVIKNHNKFQYYILRQGESGNGTYLSRQQENKAAAIAQMNYENTILQQLDSQIKNLNQFLQHHVPGAIEKAYHNLTDGRKRLIKPAVISNEEFVEQWLMQKHSGRPFLDSHQEYFTNKGLRVRSKSEIIIADALVQENIPFRYEHPLILKKKSQSLTIYPDFTCLNPKKREVFIWEHFGLFGNSDYEHNAVQKIALYSANGYILGKNLIATFEDDKTALSTKQVVSCIKTFLQ